MFDNSDWISFDISTKRSKGTKTPTLDERHPANMELETKNVPQQKEMVKNYWIQFELPHSGSKDKKAPLKRKTGHIQKLSLAKVQGECPLCNKHNLRSLNKHLIRQHELSHAKRKGILSAVATPRDSSPKMPIVIKFEVHLSAFV